MLTTIRLLVVLAAALFTSVPVRASPEDELTALLVAPLGKGFVSDWRAIESMRRVRWAPLPPKMLDSCLPDGGCFTRDGVTEVAGRRIDVRATGARTMVGNFYFRNVGAPFGEAALLDALKRSGYGVELKRCPAAGADGEQNWYLLSGERSKPGVLAIQTSCKGRSCEGFVVTPGEALPALEPEQLKMYSEQCSVALAQRQPISTVAPHEQFAQSLIALLPPAIGGHDWKSLTAAASGVRWDPRGAQPGSLAHKNDLATVLLSGELVQPGRKFGVTFGGTPAQVLTGYLEERGFGHPRGEDLLTALRERGAAVQLVRCGPVYTQSSNNWYRLTRAGARPVMLRLSMFIDGTRVTDSVALRFDASLPPRDPRDRDPGVGGCR